MVKDDEVFIAEVTILYETSSQYLEQRGQDKIKKYEKLLQKDLLQQVQCNRGRIVPIIIGALGTITQNTNKDLHQLKLQNNMMHWR